MILFIAFSIIYVAFFLWATFYWGKINQLTLNIETALSFSVIIPVRNEEENIQRLLMDLDKLDFPKSRYEVVFVNDHSTDSTSEILRRTLAKCSFAYQIIELADHFRAGKKEAITIGVEQATFDHILTTDADCSIPAEWISAFEAGYAEYDAVMLTGPVKMVGESFFQKLQTHEFAGLIGIGAASLKSGNPSMCNGANLSYRRDAFFEVNGYEGNFEIASGDDEFLLQKLHKSYPERIAFLKNRRGIITTPAKTKVRELINQRKRWSSKWKFHKSWFIKAMAVLAFLCYLTFVYGLIVCMIDGAYQLLLCILALRWISVYVFIFYVKRFLMLESSPLIALIAEIIYPFFVIFLGLASIFGKYSWKGRRYA